MNSPSGPSSQQWRQVSPLESVPVQAGLEGSTFSSAIDRDLTIFMETIGKAGVITVGATAAQELFISNEEELQQALDTLPPAPVNETITVTDIPFGDITGTPDAVSSTLQERIFLSDMTVSGTGLIKYLGLAICSISAIYDIHLISKAAGGWKSVGKTALSLGRSIIPFSPKH